MPGDATFTLDAGATGTKKVAKDFEDMFSDIAKAVKVPAYMLDTYSRKTKDIAKISEKTEKAQGKLASMSIKYGVSTQKIMQYIERNNLQIKGGNKLVDRATGKTVNWDRAMGKLKKDMKPFQMELLSVMFAGMALQRTFGGMVNEVLQLTGVFDVWRATLIMMLLPILLPFSKTLMNIMFSMGSSTLGKFVGWFIVLLATFGALLAFSGQFLLGIYGISKWKAAGDFVTWFGKDGIWSALRTAATIYLGIQLLSDIVKFDVDKIWSSIGKVCKDIGFLSVVMGKPGPGAAIAFIGIGMETVQSILDKKPITDTILELIGGLGQLGLYVGISTANPYLIGIGITLMFIKPLEALADQIFDYVDEQWKEFLRKGKPGSMAERELAGGTQQWSSRLWDMIFGKQYGGFITNPGLYRLHAGETVVPAGSTSMSSNIVINANVASDMDIRQLADKLTKYMGENYERTYSRRAVA